MTAEEILGRYARLSALVVGDICLDRWCSYDPADTDISRETGIRRLAVVATEVTPGAGGTVANNLAALGVGRVSVLGAIGSDGYGHELKQALLSRGIRPDLLIEADDICTFTYTKLLNERTGVEDRPRVDFINRRPLPESVERKIVDRLLSVASEYDVILVADQAETASGGVVTESIRNAVATIAAGDERKIVWADSRLRPERFHGVIVKPNREEAEEACGRLFGKSDFERLRRHIGGPVLLVTHGSEGVLVIDESGREWVRTAPVPEPVDICGAGDSFSAGAATALAVTQSPIEAARVGNLVASVTIMKKGTGTASPEEVLAAERRFSG